MFLVYGKSLIMAGYYKFSEIKPARLVIYSANCISILNHL